MKALIIGKNGQVAWELIQTCPSHINAMAIGSAEININDIKVLEDFISDYRPNVVINAAAYTSVDEAESNAELAFYINSQAVNNIAYVCDKFDIRLLHISTDFVFNGKSNKPYTVDAETNPINVYGHSKLAGEQAITKYQNGNSAIIRTSWVYSSHGANFVKSMLKLMAEKESLSVVSDQIGCPTYARDLAEFLWLLANNDDLKPIYHWHDLGVASWYDFAKEIQNIAFDNGLLNKIIPISPISSVSYPTPAVRPRFSLLNVSSSQSILQGRYWKDALKSSFTLIQNNIN